MTGIVFENMSGTADDLGDWSDLIWGRRPALHHVRDQASSPSFSGRLTRTVHGQMSTHRIEIEATHHLVERDAADLRDDGTPTCIAIFQLTGMSLFQQGSTASLLRPGDATVTLSDRSYRWGNVGDFSVYMAIFPPELLDVPPAELHRLGGDLLPAKHGFGASMRPFVEAVAADDTLVRGPDGSRTMQHLVELFSTRLLARVRETRTPRSSALGEVFDRACRHIRANLADPDLGTPQVARASYVSVRYLQAAFHRQGTTVSRWIRERRLATARRRLADPALSELPVRAIAEHVGLADPSHFSKAFRTAYGESPQAWRDRTRRASQACLDDRAHTGETEHGRRQYG